MLLEAHDLRQDYQSGQHIVSALADVSLSLDQGEFIAVCGPSGCGKSTLLMIVGGLLQPTRGVVRIAGQSLYELSASRRAAFRADQIGFVFQQFHLVPYLSVRDNVLSARLGATRSLDAPKRRTLELIEAFGLSSRLDHRPDQLSVGERQRVALARALLNQPSLLLADEPTGNLDAQNGDVVLAHLQEFVNGGGALLLVTHDERAAVQAGRVIRLRAGRLVEEPTTPAH